MKHASAYLGLLVAAFLLSACSYLDHGIVEGPATADDRLVGNWEMSFPDGSGLFAIGRGEAGTMIVAEAERHKGVCEIDYMQLRHTSIGGSDFAELSSLKESNSPWIIAYQFTDADHFALFGLRDEALTSAVKHKELSGEIVAADKFMPERTHVTASTSELRRFLADHGEAMRWIGSAARQPAEMALDCLD